MAASNITSNFNIETKAVSKKFVDAIETSATRRKMMPKSNSSLLTDPKEIKAFFSKMK